MGCCYSSTIPDVSFNKEWRDKLPDMTGKVVAITGCTSGTGFVAAMECRSRGATVIMLNRASARAQAAYAAVLTEGSNPGEDWRASRVGHGAQPPGEGVAPAEDSRKAQHVDCDLMSLDSVRAAAATSLAGPASSATWAPAPRAVAWARKTAAACASTRASTRATAAAVASNAPRARSAAADQNVCVESLCLLAVLCGDVG